MQNRKFYHTPGEWFSVGAWVETPDKHVPDICNCHPASMDQDHLDYSDKTIRANTKLIASAPRMLEILLAVDNCTVDDRTYRLAQQVLDYLTGD